MAIHSRCWRELVQQGLVWGALIPLGAAGSEEGPPPPVRTQVRQSLPSTEIGVELARTDDGVRIERLIENSLAAEAHLEEGDLILSVAGEMVRTPARVFEILEKLKVQQADVEIVVLRKEEERSYLLKLPGHANLDDSATVPGTDPTLRQVLLTLQQQQQRQLQLLQAILVEVRSLRGYPSISSGGQSPFAGATQASPEPAASGAIVAPLTGGIPATTVFPAPAPASAGTSNVPTNPAPSTPAPSNPPPSDPAPPNPPPTNPPPTNPAPTNPRPPARR